MNAALEQLIRDITKGINVSDQNFSDNMSQEEFGRPFDEWVRNAIDMYMKPDFQRYQYDPYMKNAAGNMANMNQNVGLTGAWRGAKSAYDLNDAAQSQLLGREQLLQDYGNQVMNVRDQFKAGWADPLYRSRMEQYYNSPTRAYDGNIAQTASVQAMPQFGRPAWSSNPVEDRNQTAQAGPATPAGQPSYYTDPSQGSQYQTNLISQYLMKPRVGSSNNFLSTL